jgi:8-oxo-dGTP pyrophosphatase MutT (NUDIX family)
MVPLRIGGEAVGRIIAAVGAVLRDLPRLFDPADTGFKLRDAGLDAAGRNQLLREAATALRAAGLVPGWRDELCVLYGAAGQELARLERGTFRTLGLQNRAVHINGVGPDGRLWIARRSAHKASSPGKLDNMAAGAISAGESPADCARRELWEEAGVPGALAAAVDLAGPWLRSQRPLRHGYHDELLLCAELRLPGDFVPCCQDGEVAEFLRLDRGAVTAALHAGEFSVEAGLVMADWLRRPGGTGDSG